MPKSDARRRQAAKGPVLVAKASGGRKRSHVSILDGGRPFNMLLGDTRPRSSAYHVVADTAQRVVSVGARGAEYFRHWGEGVRRRKAVKHAP